MSDSFFTSRYNVGTASAAAPGAVASQATSTPSPAVAVATPTPMPAPKADGARASTASAGRLLLAEDTRDLNRALVMVLEHEGYEVVSTFDGAQALAQVQQNGFDGVILDIMMPRLDGLQVLQHMRAENIYTPVLLLTAKAEVDDRVTGLDAGADDYLTKPFAMKELLARVRSMTRRHAEYTDQRLSFEDISLDAETFELAAGNAVRLSVKEFELMQVLIKHASHTLDNSYLLNHVWSHEPEADVDTVSLYISYLRGKLKWVGSCVTIGYEDDGYCLSSPSTSRNA